MSFKQVAYWMIAGSRGGVNRARILMLLERKPGNARRISQELQLDYKTVQHHLEVLLENNAIIGKGPDYGRVYFLSDESEEIFDEIKKLYQEQGQ